jgi:hypothetical protein
VSSVKCRRRFVNGTRSGSPRQAMFLPRKPRPAFDGLAAGIGLQYLIAACHPSRASGSSGGGLVTPRGSPTQERTAGQCRPWNTRNQGRPITSRNALASAPATVYNRTPE